MLNQYNSIAKYYAVLSKLIFGKSLLKIQQQAINHFPFKGKLLILGGGNGEILKFISNQRPNLEIEYLEASDKMISLAQKQIGSNQSIKFLHGFSLEACSFNIDCVFAPFFFDLFSENEISTFIKQLEVAISVNFTLVIVDFKLSKETQFKLIRTIQIKLSILFFKLCANHNLKYLPKITATLNKLGYQATESVDSRGFLFLQVFNKHL